MTREIMAELIEAVVQEDHRAVRLILKSESTEMLEELKEHFDKFDWILEDEIDQRGPEEDS